MPSGQTLVVAIATNGGYNQEDSLIFNRSAVDRGLMGSTMTKTYRSQEHTAEGTNHREAFCVPDPEHTTGTKFGGYDKLGPDGLARVGAAVGNGDVVIGKVTPVTGKGSRCRAVDTYRDSSTVLRNKTGGVVDGTVLRRTATGGRIARVRVRSERKPEVGDKFSSRHGQKGTIGMVRRQADMPFTADGVTPDVIMNPHAIPSRMTVGQLIEAVLTRLCVQVGARGDATPFTGMRPDVLRSLLRAAGEGADGNAVLHDPTTGRRLRCRIFLCPTYYQKLKHIARDKMHGRSTGPMVEMTRQPTEGRSRDGGLRLGEMERDAIAAHGMAAYTRESFLRRSDDYSVGVCAACGDIMPLNPERGVSRCVACTRRVRNGAHTGGGAVTDVRRVELPYASKLFVHELATMGVRVDMRTSGAPRVPVPTR
jgi:DNA-directed RNA polymerase II subunit RPB2